MHKSLRFQAASLLLAITCFTQLPVTSFGQTYMEQYGKNRIQHRTFKWKYFDTKHFRIYHYDRSGVELARYVAEQVENDIAIVESKMGGQFPGRFNIVLYNSYDEYKQTNIGRKNDMADHDAHTGTLDIVGDKMVVYYTGVHTDLRRQTRAGMARVVMERTLFGETLREVVRNAILMNLPEWTVNGFLAYIVDGWDAQTNSEWKNLIEAYPDAGFYKLAEVNPILAGKGFWKYVSDRYGEGSMKNLVYTTQLKSSLNQAIKMTLGMRVKTAYDSTIAFYKDVYTRDEVKQNRADSATALINIKLPKDGTIIRDIRVSPKGQDVAYVGWKDGQYTVYIQKTIKTQVRSAILEGGKPDFGAAPDPDYPILTWSNTGYKLAILYKKDNRTHLRIYNAIKAKIENYEIPANRFDRVLGMTFMEDDDRMIFSAIKKSKTDLYEFTIRGKRMKNITDDAWDDLEPWYVSGGSRRGILFISNRPKPNLDVPLAVNELPTGPMNVYFYNTTTRRKELLQLTKVTSGTISQPIQYGTDDYAYLYDSNGIVNQYIIRVKNDINKRDSAYSFPVTNHASSVIAHQYCPVGNQVADVLQVGGQYKVFYKPLLKPGNGLEPAQLSPTLLKQSEAKKKSSVITGPAGTGTTNEVQAAEPILKSGNAFETQFEQEEAPATATATGKATATIEVQDSDEPDSTYMNMRAQQYKLYFKPDFVSVKLDNSVLFTKYQPADLNGNRFNNPGLAGMVTVSLDDLMEDYRFTGGFRLPINFSGSAYFMQFENVKRRVDWNVVYYRQVQSRPMAVGYIDTSNGAILTVEQQGRNALNLVQGMVSYPLSKFESVKMHLGFRSDALDFKAQDTLSLVYPMPDRLKYWITSRVEYVFDNSASPALNIRKGFRYKFFGEYMYRLNGAGGGFYNLGLDFRYYKNIYKNLTWAVRVAGAHSAGDYKILYFLGGTDNWINPKYANSNNIRVGENYGFQALATNLRGFDQNSWNGNTFMLLNTEFRLPILTTFIQRPIQSAILRNLQLVPFADLGTAYSGLYPKETNVRNDRVVDQYFPGQGMVKSVRYTVSAEDKKDLFGLGYGMGLRTTLLGYFAKLDCAWNSANRRKTPILMFSLGLDF